MDDETGKVVDLRPVEDEDRRPAVMVNRHLVALEAVALADSRAGRWG